MLLSPHRLLVLQGLGRERRPEGLHHQPGRRLRFPARHGPPRLRPGDARHRRHRGGRRGGRARQGHGHGRGPAPVPGGHGQIRPDPALHVAARRHGRPDPRLRPHPRRDHGHGRRLHGRPPPYPVLLLRNGPHGRRPDRRLHGRLRRDHGPRPDRHQARPGLLHDLPDRVHVHRPRRRGLRRRDLPPDDPRLFQEPALPGGRKRHPRPVRRAGHAENGRTAHGASPGPIASSSSAPWPSPASRGSPASSPRTRSWPRPSPRGAISSGRWAWPARP